MRAPCARHIIRILRGTNARRIVKNAPPGRTRRGAAVTAALFCLTNIAQRSAAPPAADPLGKRRLAGIVLAAAGLLGILTTYILSRAVAVMVPTITYEQGVTWYHWDSSHTDHSWRYFIQTYDLELLTALCFLLLAGGIILFLASWPPARARITRFFDH